MVKVELKKGYSAQGAEAHSTATFFNVEKSSTTKPLTSLKSHPLNINIYGDDDHKVELLAQNIKDHSLIHKIIVNKNNQILSGNLRFKALKRLQIKEIEVEVVDIENELEFIISSNQQRQKTYVDMRNEIQSLFKKYSEGQGKSSGGANTIKKISIITGYSTSKVSTIRKIDTLHPEFLNAIDEGKLTLNGAKTRCDYIIKLKHMGEVLSNDFFSGTDPFKAEENFNKEMLDFCQRGSHKQYDMLKNKEMTALQAYDQLFTEKKTVKSEPKEAQSGKLKEDCSCPLCSSTVKDKDLMEFITKFQDQIEASINQLRKI